MYDIGSSLKPEGKYIQSVQAKVHVIMNLSVI